MKATSPCHERKQLHVVNGSVRFHYGIIVGDSVHMTVPHVQRHCLAVDYREVEVHAIGINGGSVHGSRGHVRVLARRNEGSVEWTKDSATRTTRK